MWLVGWQCGTRCIAAAASGMECKDRSAVWSRFFLFLFFLFFIFYFYFFIFCFRVCLTPYFLYRPGLFSVWLVAWRVFARAAPAVEKNARIVQLCSTVWSVRSAAQERLMAAAAW